jgi:uncharacterized repeat protein (TIGR02543 family)
MSDLAMTYDDPKTLTANAFTKTGYTFNGWNTKADGSGTSYADKASVSKLTATNGATVTLYARWKINSYTLQIDPNGGYRVSDNSTAIISITKDYNTTETISERRRTGYTLTGYTVKRTSDNSISNIGGATFSFNSSTKEGTFKQGTTDVTLTAQWTANKYTVTYNGNGSTSGSIGNSSCTYDVYFNLPSSGFIREYEVTYDANGGSCSTASDKVKHTLSHWNTRADNNGTKYSLN